MNSGFLLVFSLLVLTTLGVLLRVTDARAAARRAGLERRLATLRPALGREDDEPILPRQRAELRVPLRVRRLLARADMTLRRDLLVIWAGLVVIAGTLGAVLLQPLAGLALALVVLGLPVWHITRTAKKRMAKLAEGLPSFLEALRQLAISGNSLQQAVIKGVQGAEPDVRRYMLSLERRLLNGGQVPDALEALANRLAAPELHMLAISVRINLKHGGRIAPVLANVAAVLRDQLRVQRELRSATAETRWSGMVASGLPPLAALGICLLNPSYPEFFLHTPNGHKLLAVALGFEFTGILEMRRIMKLDY
jgi:tight adherence protein B